MHKQQKRSSLVNRLSNEGRTIVENGTSAFEDRSARATLEAELKHREMPLRSHANELPKMSMDIDECKQRKGTMVARPRICTQKRSRRSIA